MSNQMNRSAMRLNDLLCMSTPSADTTTINLVKYDIEIHTHSHTCIFYFIYMYNYCTCI